MRFSEAIRLGAMLRPQGFGHLYRHRRRWILFGPVVRESCALGAAFEAGGVGSQPAVASGQNESFRGARPAKAGTMINVLDAPAAWDALLWRETVCPQCGMSATLQRVIPHLNDQHRWTREEIAGFVERLDAGLAEWWAERRASCLIDDAWYQNDLDKADLELRRKIAQQMRAFYPSQSWCWHCHWPWGFVESHSLNYTERSGCFVVCDWCFRHLRSYGDRDTYVGYYRALMESWRSQGCEEDNWPTIEAALAVEWPPTFGSQVVFAEVGVRRRGDRCLTGLSLTRSVR